MVALCESFEHNKLPVVTCDTRVTYDSISSLARQLHQRRVKKSAHKRREKWHEYLQQYNNGATIADIAAEASFSPYLMCRIFVERLLDVDKRAVGKKMKNANMITDVRLAAEVRTGGERLRSTHWGVPRAVAGFCFFEFS